MTDPSLTSLQRELLEMIGSFGSPYFGVSSVAFDEELLESSPGRAVIEATLRELVVRGLVRSEQASSVLTLRPRDGIRRLSEADKRPAIRRDYEGKWWILTDAGRGAIGMPPFAEAVQTIWMNPSSSPFRVSPVIAPWFAWRARRGKPPVPGWYARLRRR